MLILILFPVGFDVWVGLQKEKHIQLYDNDPELFQPLVEMKVSKMMYSDHTPFDKDSDYLYGARKIRGEECFYLKASSDFEIFDSLCLKEKAFICLWTSKIPNLSFSKFNFYLMNFNFRKFDGLLLQAMTNMSQIRRYNLNKIKFINVY